MSEASNKCSIFSGYSNSFDTGVAEYFDSVDVAVVLNHIIFWLRHNKSRGVNQIDGKTWMYETVTEMASHFSYLNEKNIRYSLEKLVKEKILVKANHNKSKFERTCWYALSDESALNSKNHTVKKSQVLIEDSIKDYDLPKVSNGSENSSNSIKVKIRKEDKKRTNVEQESKEKDEDVRSFSSQDKEKIIEVLTVIGLEEDKIPSFFKYPVDEVVKAAAYASRNLKEIRNLGGYLNECILKNWIPNENPEDIIEENVKFLKTLKHLDGTTIGYYSIYVGNKYIEIVSGNKCDRFEIKSKAFVKNVSERLATLKYTV